MKYFLFILIAVIILLLMIVIHELGHYVAGKIFKFKINEFSVGFGPKIFSKKNKKTGEVFSLRAVPLGGYCAFEDESGLEGDESAEEVVDPDSVFPEIAPEPVMPPCVDPLKEKAEAAEKTRSFTEEKPWKRIIVLAAGAFFNFVSAIIFSFIFIVAVGYVQPEVYTLYADESGNNYCAELRVGDRIVAVNGERISIMKTYDDLVKVKEEGVTYDLTIARDGEEMTVTVTMRRIISKAADGTDLNYVGLGFSPINTSVRCGVGYAFKYCVPYTIKLSFSILSAFGGLITGRIPLTSITGPVGTVGAMAKLGMADLRNFLVLLPLIAANLAIFNILPIPALDGSKIVFTMIEWVRGKPVNRKVENIIHTVGLLLLFGFVIMIDILGLFL